MKKMAFNNLHWGVNRIIGSFLDYNSRIDFGRVLNNKDGCFTKQLNSEQHDAQVKVDRFSKILVVANNERNPTERTVKLTKMFDFLLDKQNIYLIESSNERLRNAFRDRATAFMREGSHDMTVLYHHPGIARELMDRSEKLLKKLDENPLKQEVVPKIVEII